MSVNDFEERFDIVMELTRKSMAIRSSLWDEYDVDINDAVKLEHMAVSLFELTKIQMMEQSIFYATLEEIREIKSTDEYEKLIFLLEKAFHEYLKDFLVDTIESIIEFSKTRSFEDYRLSNFAGEVARKLGELRDCYKEEYDL